MSLSPDFLDTLDEEVRAFINMSGIVFRRYANGSLYPVLLVNGTDYLVNIALPEGIDIRSLEFWQQTAKRAWSFVGPGRIAPL